MTNRMRCRRRCRTISCPRPGAALSPLVVIVILLNVFKMNIVVCLLAGILLSLVFLS